MLGHIIGLLRAPTTAPVPNPALTPNTAATPYHTTATPSIAAHTPYPTAEEPPALVPYSAPISDLSSSHM